MGYYIQTTEKTNKAETLMQEVPGTELIVGELPAWKDIPDGMAILCAVSNGSFDAVGLAWCEEEYEQFKMPDRRPRKWLLMPKKDAHELAGYEED